MYIWKDHNFNVHIQNNFVERSCVTVFLANVCFYSLHFHPYLKELFIFLPVCKKEKHTEQGRIFGCAEAAVQLALLRALFEYLG